MAQQATASPRELPPFIRSTMSDAKNSATPIPPTSSSAAAHEPSPTGKTAVHDEYNFDGHAEDNVSPPRGARNAGGRGDALVTVQPLQKKDMQPSYAQDLGTDDIGMGFYGSLINCLGAVAGGLGQFPCCVCCPNPFKEVQQGQVGLIRRFGKFYKAVDPGLVRLNPCSEDINRVDVKIQLSNIPRQTVMTKDNVNVEIDSVVYWHVSNPYRATFGINDVASALIERAQTTLRDVVGSRNLQSVIADREGVALQVEEIVESVAERWGVTVESILIKVRGGRAWLQPQLNTAILTTCTQRRTSSSHVNCRNPCRRPQHRRESDNPRSLPPELKSMPPDSCVKPPTSCPPSRHCNCESWTRCRTWPDNQAPRSFSFP